MRGIAPGVTQGATDCGRNMQRHIRTSADEDSTIPDTEPVDTYLHIQPVDPWISRHTRGDGGLSITRNTTNPRGAGVASTNLDGP